MTREQKFYDALRDVFVGAKVEGESGYINLMRIKSRYYTEGVFPKLQQDINDALKPFPAFRDELFEKLYDFFHRYFSESGSIYFRYTPLHQNVYEKVYTDDKDVMLFWKTHMLYYVKTDRLFKSMEVEVDGQKFFFDVSALEHKKANEKRAIVYSFKEKRKDGTLFFTVVYSEKGKKTKTDDILKMLSRNGDKINEDTLERAFRVFEKQSEVDYFINKDAKAFLEEQFNLWLYQYMFSGVSEWTEVRIKQLQTLKDIAFKIIAFISQFENELVKIWNKPKFVLNSNYVITLDRIAEKEGGLTVLEKLLAHKNFKAQVEEWQHLGIVDKSFNKTDVLEKDRKGKRPAKAWHFLPVDTKHFKDVELEILGLFDNLDTSLDGWLIKSENYQALNTILPKFRERVQTIYIDPPYNTGNDEFIYKDKFRHASWLSMIGNRSDLGLEVLSEEGSLFISIDDNEAWRLQACLEALFGRENFISQFIVQSNPRGRYLGRHVATSHEYLLLFAKDATSLELSGLPLTEKQLAEYRHTDDQGRKYRLLGLRKRGAYSRREDRPNLHYPIFYDPKSGKVRIDEGGHAAIKITPRLSDGALGVWRWQKKKVQKDSALLEVRKIESRNDYDVFQRDYLPEEGTKTIKSKSIWLDKELNYEEGKELLKEMFGTVPYDYPKPVGLIQKTLLLAGNEEGITLDFFAGSGTSAHAVINLNREDGGKRKYLLVEMADYFDSVILPRIKKVVFCEKWKDGKVAGGEGLSHFLKYCQLEQYEDALRRVKYDEADLFDDPNKDPYHRYIFLRDLKMLEGLEVETKKNKVKVDLSKLYDGIDIAETFSNLTGKWIKRITADSVEFEDGEVVDTKNLDWKRIKPLIWW